MRQCDVNELFLELITYGTKVRVFDHIADHYGIDSYAARDEVCGPEAEHLLDYLSEPLRNEIFRYMSSLGLDTIERASKRNEKQMQRIYAIPDQNMRMFEHHIAVCDKRAKKLGFQPISSRVINTRQCEKRDGTLINYVLVTGEKPQLNGWLFVGKIEHMGDSGNFVVRGDIPKVYRNCKPNCDHCKKNRLRSFTYIVKSASDDWYMQIGKSCMSDFFNHHDPHSYALMAQSLFELDSQLCEVEEYVDPLELKSGGTFCASPGEVLELAAYICLERTWITSTKAEEMLVTSSAQDVKNWLSSDSKNGARIISELKPVHKLLAQQTLAWLHAQEFDELASESPYLNNLQVLARLDVLSAKHIGIFSSAVISFQQHRDRLNEKMSAITSEFVGNVGEKLVSRPVAIKGKHFIPNAYGGKTLYRFRDEEGNVLVWFSSGSGSLGKSGDTLHINGAIKEHDTYNGVKQTVLQRLTSNEALLMERVIDICDNGLTPKKEKEIKKVFNLPLNLDWSSNRWNETALMYAARHGCSELVEALLLAGANPDPAIPGKDTALSLAANAGYADCVEVLLEHGADREVVYSRFGKSVDELLQLVGDDLKKEVLRKHKNPGDELEQKIKQSTWHLTKTFALDLLMPPKQGWETWLREQLSVDGNDEPWRSIKEGRIQDLEITVMCDGNEWKIIDGWKRVALAIDNGVSSLRARVGHYHTHSRDLEQEIHTSYEPQASLL